MINEIVERSGLLIRIDDANLLYEFAHPTLQEYLAALELAAEPDRLLALYRENPSRWRETVKLWCAGANRDATDLVRQIFAGNARDRLLALECLAEARQNAPYVTRTGSCGSPSPARRLSPAASQLRRHPSQALNPLSLHTNRRRSFKGAA